MTRINDVAALIEKRLALCDEMGVEPNPDLMTEDLLDEGHLMPDLPEPWSDADCIVYFGDDFAVCAYRDGQMRISDDGAWRPTTARSLREDAAAMLAAANYAERNL